MVEEYRPQDKPEETNDDFISKPLTDEDQKTPEEEDQPVSTVASRGKNNPPSAIARVALKMRGLPFSVQNEDIVSFF